MNDSVIDRYTKNIQFLEPTSQGWLKKFHLLASPVHPTGFSSYFFPGFLAIFILLSSNNNILKYIFVGLKNLNRYQITLYKI